MTLTQALEKNNGLNGKPTSMTRIEKIELIADRYIQQLERLKEFLTWAIEADVKMES